MGDGKTVLLVPDGPETVWSNDNGPNVGTGGTEELGFGPETRCVRR